MFVITRPHLSLCLHTEQGTGLIVLCVTFILSKLPIRCKTQNDQSFILSILSTFSSEADMEDSQRSTDVKTDLGYFRMMFYGNVQNYVFSYTDRWGCNWWFLLWPSKTLATSEIIHLELLISEWIFNFFDTSLNKFTSVHVVYFESLHYDLK